MLRITCLMENTNSKNRSLVCGHGLSFYLDTGDGRFLFDCGPDGGFMHNASRLGIDLSGISAVILSHNHYDHASGFRDFLASGLDCPLLYTGPGFFEEKYSQEGFKNTYLSCGYDHFLLERSGIRHSAVKGFTDTGAGLLLVSSFDRKHGNRIPGRFVKLRGVDFIPDDFSDEVAAVYGSEKGPILITGCAHPGILNMAETVCSRLGKKLYAIVGGFHLFEADRSELEEVAYGLRDLGVSTLGMCHCTGQEAEEMIGRLGCFECFHFSTGDMVRFQ